MSERARQLHASAERQLAELLALVSTQTHETLRQPCPGRQKLGDGSVGALIAHTAENYQRIADFAAGRGQQASGHVPPRGAHKLPRFLRAGGHRPPDHGSRFTAATADPGPITQQLTAARRSLAQIATLSDQQLDAVPLDGSFRFCDGQRSLQQVLEALLKHQDRQLDTIRAAGG